LMHESGTKFIAFFASNDLLEIEKQFNIEYDPEIYGDDYYGVDKDSDVYAFMVIGILHESKWYLEKENSFFFNLDGAPFEEGKKGFFANLAGFGFFEEGTAKPTDHFWESNFFEKIPDLREDPEWQKNYASGYRNFELENRPYVGMYKLVANQIKTERMAKEAALEQRLLEEYVKPLLPKLKSKYDYEDLTLKHGVVDFMMLYPLANDVFICPIRVRNKEGKKWIQYVVLIPNVKGRYDLYEWTYLNPDDFVNEKNDPRFSEQIKTLTKWAFGYEYLEDEAFWQNYVLKKEGNSFLYLKSFE